MESILPGFKSLSIENQFKTILCPTKPAAIKVTNQYLRILFLSRDKIMDGSDNSMISYPTVPIDELHYNCNCNHDWPSDVEDEWDIYESDLDTSQDT